MQRHCGGSSGPSSAARSRIPYLAAFALVIVAPLLSAQGLFRSIDGTGNNRFHPDWGSALIPLLRIDQTHYDDGMNTPAGANRPSAREISNAVCAQSGSMPNQHPITDYVWQWGQFIDHDLDLTSGLVPVEVFDIAIPQGDPFFDPAGTGNQVMPFARSNAVIGTSPQQPRQQINDITAFIDGSMVYGSDDARAMALRALDGTGKLLVSAGDLLPFNTAGLANAPTGADPTLFVAGDVRANEQVGLTSLHTLFVREHNTICDALGFFLPFLDDEFRYQIARAFVIAEIQHITFHEWLPVLLGHNAMPHYNGYRPQTNPGIANEFSTAAFRIGHTLLSPVLLRLDANGNPIAAGHLPLQNAFFNPAEIINHGIEPILRGLAGQRPQEVDPLLVDDVRNFLFGPPGSGGFDLASLNIQRGRDHGLPSYNEMRQAMNLTPAQSFAQITADPQRQSALASVYASVNDVDLWVGALSEDAAPSGIVGPLIRRILRDQFRRVRDGDRFWYERHLAPPFRSWVESQSLAEIIRRNTTIGAEIGNHVFVE